MDLYLNLVFTENLAGIESISSYQLFQGGIGTSQCCDFQNLMLENSSFQWFFRGLREDLRCLF